MPEKKRPREAGRPYHPTGRIPTQIPRQERIFLAQSRREASPGGLREETLRVGGGNPRPSPSPPPPKGEGGKFPNFFEGGRPFLKGHNATRKPNPRNTGIRRGALSKTPKFSAKSLSELRLCAFHAGEILDLTDLGGHSGRRVSIKALKAAAPKSEEDLERPAAIVEFAVRRSLWSSRQRAGSPSSRDCSDPVASPLSSRVSRARI